MSNTINKFEGIETQELIAELRSRGYVTNLLWNRNDVQAQIDNINSDREEDEKVTLEEYEMDNILDGLSFDYHCERINEEIFDAVWDYIK